MIAVLVLFALGLVAEGVLYAFARTRIWRVVLAALSLVATMAAAGVLAVLHPGLWTALWVMVSLYRTVNVLRVVQGRMHERYLRTATRRTALVLLLWQLGISMAWLAWARWHATGHTTWGVIAGIECLIAAVLLASTVRSLRRTRWISPTNTIPDSELPAITVAIPARNETDDLEACLSSIITSDYPKLEVLVLDDCSQNKRTPEIIRSFAHDGVRFVQGEEPRKTWLAKNQAYHKLTSEASGSYIVFCGVDVRFAPDSLRQLITMMITSKKQMVSILPQRVTDVMARLPFIQAMRYWWELVPPRRIFNRPPVLSTCWAIKTEALHRAGGFEAVARSIVPEAYFAKRLTPEDAYSFRRGGRNLGVTSTKTVAEQRATAIRTRYPQVHRRPEQVLAISSTELFTLVLPFVLALGGAWLPIGPAAWILSILASALLIATHLLVVRSTQLSPWWTGVFSLPPMVLVDVGLLLYSMWQYEFSTVEWKGRNVCIPVMHVVPHLPPIN